MVDLKMYDNSWFKAGRSKPVQILWYILNYLVLYNPLFPFSLPKILLLRLFGAKIGQCVVIKQRVSVKYPWRLEIGANSWIGENVWLDNLESIIIGKNVCISQGCYLCTGSHDWSDPGFGLIVRPIKILDGSWLSGYCKVSPGVVVEEGAVLQIGSVVSGVVPAFTICGGNPCVPLKKRRIK